MTEHESTPLTEDRARELLTAAAEGPTAATFETVYRRAHRQRLARRSGLAAAAAVVLAAAVAVPTMVLSSHRERDVAVLDGGPTPPAAAVDPLALVGIWQVSAAGGDPGDAVLFGDRRRMDVFLPCGVLDGAWDADRAGLFVANATAGDDSCFSGGSAPSVPWLDAAVGFQVRGSDRLLVDAAGQVVATLSPGAQPTYGPNRLDRVPTPPQVTPALRTAFADPAPLPAGVTPATPQDLVGRWQPLGAARGNGRAFVSFGADRHWSGGDGCNGEGGSFAVGPGGELLGTAGPTTLVGCDNSPVPSWVIAGGRVGADGQQLVFYDHDGKLLGRCARVTS